ncbi:hypothetical protein [Actinoplanes rectilineatus]|uniref:hypothetical protein n=1 Tax=Actinoplanes rectilineatus TaxID=113571 RepID=UPI0005F29650|nr:hypothetical protein [Actinoplanes rectilineatus]
MTSVSGAPETALIIPVPEAEPVVGDPRVPVLRQAAEQLSGRLPITARADTLRLLVGRREPGDSWAPMSDFPLG